MQNSPTNYIKAFRAINPELAFMKDVEMLTLLVFKQQLYAAYYNFILNIVYYSLKFALIFELHFYLQLSIDSLLCIFYDRL